MNLLHILQICTFNRGDYVCTLTCKPGLLLRALFSTSQHARSSHHGCMKTIRLPELKAADPGRVAIVDMGKHSRKPVDRSAANYRNTMYKVHHVLKVNS